MAGRTSLARRRRLAVVISALLVCTIVAVVAVWIGSAHDGSPSSSADTADVLATEPETADDAMSTDATEAAEATAAPEPESEEPDSEPEVPAAPTVQSAPVFHGPAFGDATQVIVVTADSLTSTRATLATYQESGGTWSKVMSTGAYVGKRGLVPDAERIEGQLQTPIGVYSLPYAFGIAANPNTGSTSLEYKPVGSNTYYDGNYGSPTFNDLIEGVPTAGDNYEYMYLPTAYKYGIDTGFNLEEKPGKGNAIFIHCNTGSGYTAGCVSVSEDKMVELLRWLDRTQHPVVLICLTGDLDSFYY